MNLHGADTVYRCPRGLSSKQSFRNAEPARGGIPTYQTILSPPFSTDSKAVMMTFRMQRI